ncbi:hypothetical protein LPJ78_002618 [Coemansia sp. RSA 989]|nr:hypothetical protein BX667DRAFT_517453 [Coemansia mojavensis]KAJ1743253.1 hypothetical protein LPJ68_001143 [Coemansia sp. RSA 1086]KAJ1751867.1 hypothetical protein LPJ79_001709 [Coemansia sp. RSA 1821]KAJ1865538.1 hypothetical protein LPJ78_002618 [Coemansia sp. RSA 989]KAJ1873953.1 hypothetical protein LPJ55_001884 [Coemansia sp. RSA 990]KAJ2632445.1 hypothetical protein H4R22_001257 [Coemansia sp. RSA 1290]KAJ2650228.1 hypothetical protein IWW40_002601 [Coemansia sp. RSA 1250]KAJ26702
MRFTSIVLLITAAVALSAPVVRRDMDGAKAAFNTIGTSANDNALVSNTNTFFANLKGSASDEEINRAVKQVSDQIATNNRDGVPTRDTAAWVQSILVHFVADQPKK